MVTFKNGTAYEEVKVFGAKQEFQNAKRDTLDIVVSSDQLTLDEAKALWQDTDATSEFTITYEEEVDGEIVTKTGVYINYTLPMELKVDTLNGVEVIHIKLAQMSALEIAQAAQAEEIELTQAALVEALAMIGGE